jgi:hypothetical protein
MVYDMKAFEHYRVLKIPSGPTIYNRVLRTSTQPKWVVGTKHLQKINHQSGCIDPTTNYGGWLVLCTHKH